MSRHLAIQKRRSSITNTDFPFEILHTEDPARNMELFHWHDFLEISLVRRGKGTFEIENSVFEVLPGDLVIIDSGQRHRVSYPVQEPLYESVLHFGPSLLGDLAPSNIDQTYSTVFAYQGRAFTNAPPLSPNSRAAVEALVDKMIEEYAHHASHHRVMIKGLLLQVISHILRACEQADGSTHQDVQGECLSQADEIRRYVKAHFREPLSLDKLGEAFNMNPTYFSTVFKRLLGVTFSEYLADLRVQAATEMINEGGHTAEEIAAACGFSSTTSYYRAFRFVTGMNPTEYRNVCDHRTVG